MRRYQTDVAVIGSGAAGMVAAMEARRKGAEVLVLGKGATGKGTCTSLAGGVFAAASDQVSPQAHYETTVAAGKGLNDPRRVEMVVAEARASLQRLAEAGAPLRPMARGFSVDNRGNSRLIPGLPLVEALRKILRGLGVATLPRFHGLDLLQSRGRVAGILGIEADGQPAVISAPSVVLAAGGAGALYPRNDNPRGITGDGYALALRAGLTLQDMEFVQFYPLGIAHPGRPSFLVYPPYPREARLLDGSGSDVLAGLEGCEGLTDAIIRFRDTASLLFHRKHKEGGLYLDLSAVAPDDWQSLYSLRLLARSGLDFRRQRLGIAPITHFFMGGVVVNERAETSLPGLFAAGEVTGGFHGANRLGGNALTECAVCGAIAGVRAAENARNERAAELPRAEVQALLPAWAGGGSARVRPEYGQLESRILRAAWNHAGIVRTERGMRDGLELASRLASELEELRPRGPAEGLREHRARSALLVLRCILEASLRRTESRGGLFREDYPETDEALWRRNIRISLDRQSGQLALTETAGVGR